MEIIIEDLLKTMVKMGASDLHLTTGAPPIIRVDEKLLVAPGYERLVPDTCKKLIYSLLTPSQIEAFENDLELDMAFGIAGLSRFRVKVFMQRGVVHSA